MTESPKAIINLDRLVTPEEIAKRITLSSGVFFTARTVAEKARRVGVARKLGRAVLISIDDIPALLKEEEKKARRENPKSTKQVMAMLKRARKEQQKARLEKMR